MVTRPAAVAGTWYPASAEALTREVDTHLDAATARCRGDIRAIVAPHAGIMFSGPVGAYAYKAVAAQHYDVAVLVGPSHFVRFDGVAAYPDGAFATPLGPALVDEATAAALSRFGSITAQPAVHAREHSLEMHLPFIRRLFPYLPIVPLLMGGQTRSTIDRLAAALAEVLRARRALLVASTDLSHYFNAETAARLDGEVATHVEQFDVDGLTRVFERYAEPDRGRFVGCGMGPLLSVMKAARALGARDARVLHYGHSGEISGDFGGVVGYLAAAFGTFVDRPEPAWVRTGADR
jgi:AmmeMemoRadiSam system protein B